MTEIKIYTIGEISEILHISRKTLYSYVKEGKLKAVKVGRSWIVTAANLEEFLSKGTDG